MKLEPIFKQYVKVKKSLYLPMALLLFGLITHFFMLGQPKEVVFDEIYFGRSTNNYFTGKYFFDIHPPLGKLIIATGAKLGGYDNYIEKNGAFDFSKIGNQYGTVPVFWFRFFPALAGAFLPLVIFLFLKSIKVSERIAFFAGILILLENSLLTQSRFILLDIFILFFGFLGLYLFFLAREKKYYLPLIILSAISFAASFSTKWTGLSYIVIALGIIAWDFFDWLLKKIAYLRLSKKKQKKEILIFNVSLGRLSLSASLLFFIASLVYLGCFYIHFALLPKFAPQEVFIGKLPFIERVIEVNRQMYTSNSNFSAKHQDESTPMQWVTTLKKPVHYWLKIEKKQISQIIFFGNPFIWIFGILGVICFPVFWNKIKLKTEIKLALFFGFWLNFIPFFLVKRLLFLYHYLSALVFSIILFSILVFILEEKKKLFFPLISILMTLSVFGFLIFSNFIYGFPLSDGWQKSLTRFFMYSK